MSNTPPLTETPLRSGAFPDVPGVDLDRLPLLLHSMSFFRGFYEPLMASVEPKRVCEIGIEGAATTRALIEWCRERGATYVGIDPTVGGDIAALIEAAEGEFHSELSLKALPQVAACDVYFVDGDHNFYTVRRELELIHEARRDDDRPMLVMLHDVGWPWARRDLYYAPDTVPEEGVHDHSFERGVRPGTSRLERGGFRSLGQYAAAHHEGGDDNGVLTAVDSFVDDHNDQYRFLRVPAVFGFGLIYRPATLPDPARERVAEFESGLGWFEPLIATLERNRLDLYCEVVDQQDRLVAGDLRRMELELTRTRERELRRQHQRITHGWRGLGVRPILWFEKSARRSAWLAVQFAKRQRHLWKARKGLVAAVESLDQIVPHATDRALVTFDIFDTLVRRDIEPPGLVHRRTAHRASDILAKRGTPIDPEIFHSMRCDAEARVRAKATAAGFDHEVTLDEILSDALANVVFGPERARVVEQLVDYEVACERQHLSAAPSAVETLRGLAASGVRLAAVSDMYLRSEHLREILEDCGLAEFLDGHIYVSSEPRLGKYSGRLFDHVHAAEEVEPAETLHIGDNIVSDVRAPIAKGIPAIFLRDPRDESRRRAYHDRVREIASPRDVERVLDSAWSLYPAPQSRRPSDGASDTDRTLYDIGYRHVGPAYTVFVMQAMEASLAADVDRAFFLSRDGFILQRIWETLRAETRRFAAAALPADDYLYVSRVSTTLAAVEEFGDREITLGYWRDDPRGLITILRTAGLDPAEFRDLFARAGIDDPEENVEHPHDYAPYRALFADEEFRRRVAERRDVARELLRDYLTGAGYFGESLHHALIDIGWNGTIQINFARAFANDPQAPHLTGVYLGRHYCPYYDYSEAKSSYPPGLFYDQSRRDDDECAVERFIPFMEMCASGPHGSTRGYERKSDGSVEPILKPHESVRELELIQAGILDAAEAFAVAYNHHELPTRMLHEWAARRLAQFIRTPTITQVRAIASLQHDLDWGTGDKLRLVGSEVSPLSLLRPRQVMNAIRTSAWREGTAKLTRAPWLVELASNLKTRLRG